MLIKLILKNIWLSFNKVSMFLSISSIKNNCQIYNIKIQTKISSS